MNLISLLFLVLLVACNSHDHKTTEDKNKDSVQTGDKKNDLPPIEEKPVPPPAKDYSNQRFRDVTVEKTGEHTFLVKGKGQIFEASFSWVVEDGHEELKQGHEMTDAGAPEWGNFSFTVDVAKKRPNSTLHLILFESSPKDGSRQHQLPLLLY